MNQWMRPSEPAGLFPEDWHLEEVRTRHGMRVARCGESYLPGDALEEMAFSDPPAIEDRCLKCTVGFTSFRIPAQPRQPVPNVSEMLTGRRRSRRAGIRVRRPARFGS